MEEYEQLGHMEPAKTQEGKHPCYFQPLHPVFKATCTNRKTQVYFDRGAKISNGLSLNNILHVGPNAQQELFHCTAVQNPSHVFTPDIEKMYRQINVLPQDRYLQEFYGILF